MISVLVGGFAGALAVVFFFVAAFFRVAFLPVFFLAAVFFREAFFAAFFFREFFDDFLAGAFGAKLFGASRRAVIGAVIGAVSFSGSVIAFAKLQGIMKKTIRLPMHQVINIGLFLATVYYGYMVATGHPVEFNHVIIFFVLACQCLATVAVVKRETNSWKWALFQLVGLTAVAYVLSLLIYQIGSLFV